MSACLGQSELITESVHYKSVMFYCAGPGCQLCKNLFTISNATIGIFTEYVDQDYTNSGENYTAKSFKNRPQAEPIFFRINEKCVCCIGKNMQSSFLKFSKKKIKNV